MYFVCVCVCVCGGVGGGGGDSKHKVNNQIKKMSLYQFKPWATGLGIFYILRAPMAISPSSDFDILTAVLVVVFCLFVCFIGWGKSGCVW